jgi:hypothetical protein
VPARVLRELNLEKSARQLGVERVDVVAIAANRRRGRVRLGQIGDERAHPVVHRAQTGQRPIGRQRVEFVYAGERRVHGAASIIMLEKTIERLAHDTAGDAPRRLSLNVGWLSDSRNATMSAAGIAG